MKRCLVALLLVTLAVAASCQTVVYKKQATLQWSAVTTDSEGQAFLPTDVVTYDVYIKDSVGTQVFMGNTSATELFVVFPFRVRWWAGVRTKLTDEGGNVEYSEIAWSDVAANCESGVPFVYSPLGIPRRPSSLRDKGM